MHHQGALEEDETGEAENNRGEGQRVNKRGEGVQKGGSFTSLKKKSVQVFFASFPPSLLEPSARQQQTQSRRCSTDWRDLLKGIGQMRPGRVSVISSDRGERWGPK